MFSCLGLESPGGDIQRFPIQILPRFLHKVIEPLRQSFELLRHLRAIFWKLAAQTCQRLRSGAGRREDCGDEHCGDVFDGAVVYLSRMSSGVAFEA